MQIFDTRQEMLKALPKGMVMAELGVFDGSFAKDILEICQPQKLYLIDLWAGTIMSGNQDGNNVVHRNGGELFREVVKIAKDQYDKLNYSQVEVFRAETEKIKHFDYNSIDAVYIDADHSYSGCLKDLINSFNTVKNGGYIMGHDYETNFSKTQTDWKFGVKQAVDEFCKEYNQEISAKAMDGQVSYLIKVKK